MLPISGPATMPRFPVIMHDPTAARHSSSLRRRLIEPQPKYTGSSPASKKYTTSSSSGDMAAPPAGHV
eukprot:scaffold195_cov359-Prasinococcus_capsulatus_cf.AAC.9